MRLLSIPVLPVGTITAAVGTWAGRGPRCTRQPGAACDEGIVLVQAYNCNSPTHLVRFSVKPPLSGAFRREAFLQPFAGGLRESPASRGVHKSIGG